MLGRGVKRKWSCLDELEPELLPVTTHEKKQDEEKEAKANELLERQVVLSLCLEKLQRYQAGVELSLRRSVLLVNTLRQIQGDMRSDGAGDYKVQPESHHVKAEFREEDVPVMCRGCVDNDDLPPPPTLSSEFISQASNNSSDPHKAHKFDICSISDAVNAMGYLSDLALDDIFEDIDTSMYETTDLSTAMGAGSVWPMSMSLWTDEEIKLCPPAHSSSPGSLPSCLMDLNDLDHLMEILIKSWSTGWTQPFKSQETVCSYLDKDREQAWPSVRFVIF